MIFLISFLILLSCLVYHLDMESSIKSTYFVFLGIFVALLFLLKVIL